MRTCVAIHACLHIIGPLSFSIDSKDLKRVGMDYIDDLKMWMKHFKGYTYKIVKSINIPANHYLLKSSFMKDEELASQTDFVPSNIEGLYRYQGK